MVFLISFYFTFEFYDSVVFQFTVPYKMFSDYYCRLSFPPRYFCYWLDYIHYILYYSQIRSSLILSFEEISFSKTGYLSAYIDDSFLIYYYLIFIWRRARESESLGFYPVALISRPRYLKLGSRIRPYYEVFFLFISTIIFMY
jgi:hypothetical protein